MPNFLDAFKSFFESSEGLDIYDEEKDNKAQFAEQSFLQRLKTDIAEPIVMSEEASTRDLLRPRTNDEPSFFRRAAEYIPNASFKVFDILSRTAGGITEGGIFKKQQGIGFKEHFQKQPTLYEATVKEVEKTPLGKVPLLPAILGIGAEIALPGPEIAKIEAKAKSLLEIPDLISYGKALENIAMRAKAGEKLSQKDISFLKTQGISISGIKKFTPPSDLSTKLLEEFRGMPEQITEQQFREVLNRAKKKGIKQADEQIITSSLVREGDKIDLAKTSARVEEKLVPLTPTQVKSPRYSSTGQDFIGAGKYEEIVFQSPIKTSAGDVHFRADEFGAGVHYQPDTFPRYFSHVRREVLPDKKGVKYIEWQSDLMQKDNFPSSVESMKQYENLGSTPVNAKDMTSKEWNILEKQRAKSSKLATKETGLLEPYSSNDPLAHLRTFREAVKMDAKAGKEYMLTPTGETAMKIEGLGTSAKWSLPGVEGRLTDLSKLKVDLEIIKGETVGGGMRFDSRDRWRVVEVLQDGRFRAVPKRFGKWRVVEENGYHVVQQYEGQVGTKPYNMVQYKTRELAESKLKYHIDSSAENFDLLGKEDTQHFVYKLNEEAIPREARKMGLEVVGKVKRDNGEWWLIKYSKERARMPVEAFGIAPLLFPPKEND